MILLQNTTQREGTCKASTQLETLESNEEEVLKNLSITYKNERVFSVGVLGDRLILRVAFL